MRVRYWWHPGTFVDDVRAAAPEYTVALEFVQGLKADPRRGDGLRDEEDRRLNILAGTRPPLLHDHHA